MDDFDILLGPLPELVKRGGNVIAYTKPEVPVAGNGELMTLNGLIYTRPPTLLPQDAAMATIVLMATTLGKSVRILNLVYIYNDNFRYWVRLCSPEARSLIAYSLSINAPVNFYSATEPYALCIIQNTRRNFNPEGTVCLGGCRLRYAVHTSQDGNDKLMSFEDTANGLKSYVVKAPTLSGCVPRLLSLNNSLMMCRELMLPFKVNQQLLILYWIGKVLTGDVVSAPAIYLYGKAGEEGKGVFMEKLKSVLEPTMVSLDADFMNTTAKAPSTAVLSTLSNFSFASLDEVDVKDEINIRNLKAVHSGGSVTTETGVEIILIFISSIPGVPVMV